MTITWKPSGRLGQLIAVGHLDLLVILEALEAAINVAVDSLGL